MNATEEISLLRQTLWNVYATCRSVVPYLWLGLSGGFSIGAFFGYFAGVVSERRADVSTQETKT